MKITGALLESRQILRPFSTSQPLHIVELELAEPGPGEALVKIEAAGLCHSDLSVITGDRPRPLPMLLGHEACGSVEAVGPGTKGVGVGQRVVMSFLPRCEHCDSCISPVFMPCEEGTRSNVAGTLLSGESRLSRAGAAIHHHLGVSAFANYAVVSEKSLVVIEDDVPSVVAAVLGCAVLTGAGAVFNVARPQPGSTLAVVGLGGVGMAAVLAAVREPLVRVIAIDLSDERRAQAHDLGAHETFSPAEATAGTLKADVVIEAAGNSKAFQTAVALTARGGRTITVGLPNPQDNSSLSVLDLVAEGRSIIGCYMGSSNPQHDIPKLLTLWREGGFPIERLVTSTTSLGGINEALDNLADARGIRQIIDFDSRH